MFESWSVKNKIKCHSRTGHATAECLISLWADEWSYMSVQLALLGRSQKQLHAIRAAVPVSLYSEGISIACPNWREANMQLRKLLLLLESPE